MVGRPILEHEKLILDFMCKEVASFNIIPEIPEFAYEMDDGGMGSVKFLEETHPPKKQVGSCSFKDKDGVLVICDLFLDGSGRISELSFWRVDFEPVNVFPTSVDELLTYPEDS